MKLPVKIFSFLIAFLMISCSSVNEDEKRITQLNEEIEELKKSKIAEDSAVDYYVTYANSLHENLDLITSKQKELLGKIKKDPSLLSKGDTTIESEIKLLGEMIKTNNEELNNFKTSYTENSPIDSKGVIQLIDNVTEDMEDKNSSIVELQTQLEAVDVAFDDLFSVFGETLAELDETKSTLSQTKNYLNTVWYIVDSKKSLEEKGIIAVEGGFIGIGKNEALNGNFNISHFTKGDKKTLRKIAIPKNIKKYELVSSHPNDSYNVENNILEILNTNDFWSVSKYLVISTK